MDMDPRVQFHYVEGLIEREERLKQDDQQPPSKSHPALPDLEEIKRDRSVERLLIYIDNKYTLSPEERQAAKTRLEDREHYMSFYPRLKAWRDGVTTQGPTPKEFLDALMIEGHHGSKQIIKPLEWNKNCVLKIINLPLCQYCSQPALGCASRDPQDPLIYANSWV